MKKLLLIVVLLQAGMCTAFSQTTGPKYRNAVLGGFGYEIANSNGQYFTYSIEYTRHIKNRMHWGVTASLRDIQGRHTTYDWDGSGPDPYRNSLSIDIPTVTGMIYYELPVIGNVLALRGGAGVGIGYHLMRGDDRKTYKDKISPYLTAKLQWVIRPLPRLEINIAPLIVGPSTAAVAPWPFGAPSDKKLLAYFNMAHIQVGCRF